MVNGLLWLRLRNRRRDWKRGAVRYVGKKKREAYRLRLQTRSRTGDQTRHGMRSRIRVQKIMPTKETSQMITIHMKMFQRQGILYLQSEL